MSKAEPTLALFTRRTFYVLSPLVTIIFAVWVWPQDRFSVWLTSMVIAIILWCITGILFVYRPRRKNKNRAATPGSGSSSLSPIIT